MKPVANPNRVRRVQDLRRSNASGPIASTKTYSRKKVKRDDKRANIGIKGSR